MSQLSTADLERYFERVDRLISAKLDAPPHKFTVIAFGGTSLTLRGWKASTKDVDFMIVDAEHTRFRE